MRKVFLVYGKPDAGKSYLAGRLETGSGCHRLSVDDAYVQFIKAECPMLYFEALAKYIGPHYDGILECRQYSLSEFGRDFVAEWKAHLFRRVRALAGEYNNLVVEGYLLTHCLDDLQTDLKGHAQVFPIHVEKRVYRWQGQTLTLEQVAALAARGTL